MSQDASFEGGEDADKGGEDMEGPGKAGEAQCL